MMHKDQESVYMKYSQCQLILAQKNFVTKIYVNKCKQINQN